MNRKITPAQAVHIRRLINQQHLKLREVRASYPLLSLAQIHRIATGENWQSVTGAAVSPSSGSLRNADTKR
jgi:hypothetical protein